ncbi:MAG: porphobilinogen synthase [Firmicutes bacterium]|nr:porphobilinogen synthase [Bacillota bacterium]
MYPQTRLRRLRQTDKIRRLVRETGWDFEDLIYPFFVKDGLVGKEEIPAMPGVFHYSTDALLQELEGSVYQELGGILLFGIPGKKDEVGSNAWAADGIIQRTCRAIKARYPEILVITDLCLCAYTSHGHCGILNDAREIDNDRTLPLLERIALSYAEAGADIIAPSDMMDGRIGYIRRNLDEHGFFEKLLMAYSAKFASAFYGPFRDASGSAPQFGDRQSYQLPPANRREALREMEADIQEGADLLMVKPALAYLDIIREARQRFDLPLVGYNVSGEYAMVKAAAKEGWIEERKTVEEIIIGMKRAGLDLVITYHAKDLYQWNAG